MKTNLYNQLVETLLEICPINEEMLAVIRGSLIAQKLPKGTHLVTIGEISDKIFYVVKGLLRSYYYVDKKEVTSWLAAEREFAVSTHSFLRQEPSFENVELLEDAELFFISYPDLQRLYRQHPSMNLIGRVLTEKYLLSAEARIRSLRMLNAEERYYRFCQQYPGLCERTPLKHIASYLGLSRFTLSRLRGQKIRTNLLL